MTKSCWLITTQKSIQNPNKYINPSKMISISVKISFQSDNPNGSSQGWKLCYHHYILYIYKYTMDFRVVFLIFFFTTHMKRSLLTEHRINPHEYSLHIIKKYQISRSIILHWFYCLSNKYCCCNVFLHWWCFFFFFLSFLVNGF